jgi:tetratricopeptide (TPR) repeat protein
MTKEFMTRLQLSLLLALAILPCSLFAQTSSSPQQSATKTGEKRLAQAKTQAEFKDYNAAYAISGGAAMEKAADDFAAKYPDSELKPFLYSKAMHEYEQENNPPKILSMAEKVLHLDPDNSVALVMSATVLSDLLSDTNPDPQKVAEIRKDADRALQTVNTSFSAPANTPPAQAEAYKSMLQAMAHSALGITNLKSKDDAGAEKELKAAADLGKAQPDPYIWYHLALAQDHQKKYAEALASVNEALRYTGSNPDLDKLAHGERARLMQLTEVEQREPNKSPPPH